MDWKNGFVDIASGTVTKRFTYAAMELEVRQTGVVGQLQRLLDRSDGVFGGTMGEVATPNVQITVKTEYAGWAGQVQGPCRIGLATDDLTEDILHYRREACITSADYTFRALARHYRAYLASCLSLVDAFINRHILLASHDGFESEAFARLKEARGMEEKIDCWLETCCENKTFKHLAARKEWDHFQVIRQERNALQHAVEPFSVYSIKRIARLLNYTQSGIGELLRLLRGWHDKPTVLFIERLRTAPAVEYHHVVLKADPSSG